MSVSDPVYTVRFESPVGGAFAASLFISEAELRRERSRSEFRDLLRQAFNQIGERAMRDWEALHGQS
jgi:hypothetical protein